MAKTQVGLPLLALGVVGLAATGFPVELRKLWQLII